MFTQNTFLSSINPERSANLRVMSTPEWPVPYYQRIIRAPVSRENTRGNIDHIAVPISDIDVIKAKENLKADGYGYVVEAIENHFNLKSYIFSFNDSAQFSNAYTDDLLDCINVAFE